MSSTEAFVTHPLSNVSVVISLYGANGMTICVSWGARVIG